MNNTNEFTPGQPVVVNKTPKESAFGGWIGTVNEKRASQLGPEVVSVDFDHAVYGRFSNVVFQPDELKHKGAE